MQIIIVEDDNHIFKEMETTFTRAGIVEIQRVNNGREAFIKVREMQERAIWIIDGIFPFHSAGKNEKLGPDVVSRIRMKRGEDETIIGFSSEPDIFASMKLHKPKHIFDKRFFLRSTAEMTEIILNSSNEQ